MSYHYTLKDILHKFTLVTTNRVCWQKAPSSLQIGYRFAYTGITGLVSSSDHLLCSSKDSIKPPSLNVAFFWEPSVLADKPEYLAAVSYGMQFQIKTSLVCAGCVTITLQFEAPIYPKLKQQGVLETQKCSSISGHLWGRCANLLSQLYQNQTHLPVVLLIINPFPDLTAGSSHIACLV